MIFTLIAENHENMIFTLNVFTQMLYFMQWVIKSYDEQIKTISKKFN